VAVWPRRGNGTFERITDLSAAEFANDLSFIRGP
jgi:hypothetical protein